MNSDHKLSTIKEGIAELAAGRMLVVVDSPDRENQGDIIFPASVVDLDKMNFLLAECRGMICVALSKGEAVRLELPLMVPPIDSTEKTGVQFTVTVDDKNVEAFGISSADRVKTVLRLGNQKSVPTDLVRPGHVFPLLARDGGVIERQGHTEATVDLCRLAGFPPVGVLSEILKEDGEPARLPELVAFAEKHGLKIVSVEDLHTYLKQNPLLSLDVPSTKKVASSKLPTRFGTFDISVYKNVIDSREHVFMKLGTPKDPVLTRIHSECLTGDTLFSERCDCRAQLEASMKRIGDEGEGVLIYLDQEGRSIGLANKIKAYALQDTGRDTVEANEDLGLPIDAREYGMVADMLNAEGIRSVLLLTNNPEKVSALQSFGIEVKERVPLETEPTDANRKYLATKKEKLKHLFAEHEKKSNDR